MRMRVNQTAKIKIVTTSDIVETIDAYKSAMQFCIDVAWEKGIKNNIRLHPFVYTELRKTLPSQIAIGCIKQSCGIIKKAKSKSTIKFCSIRYNFPRSASFKNNVLSISTIKGRVKIPFTVPDCYKRYFLNDWKVVESLLRIDNKGRTFFLFTFSKEVDVDCSHSQNRVLGIDLGVNNIAVTSDAKFYTGTKQLRIKHNVLTSKLQAKGTRASKRKLKKRSGNWRRFMTWTNHNISKRIVDDLKESDIVVMEDLSNIRRTSRYNVWVHRWAFRQLQSFIEYKSTLKGCRVVYVNPAYTSKSCSRCHCEMSIRHTGFFECKTCGHTLNADLNGARNIAQRYMRNMSRAIVNKPILACDDAIPFG